MASTGKRALVHSEPNIAHELGYVGDWLTERGFTVERVFRDNTGEPIHFPDADLLINLGSLNSAADGCQLPAAVSEIGAVSEWVDTGRTYIGICYGAQLLAKALGGTVTRQPSTERSMASLDLDAPYGPWVRWHEDFITHPGSGTIDSQIDEAIMLFHSGTAWGIQPHLELTPDTLSRMGISAHTPPELYEPLVQDLRAQHESAKDSTFRLLDYMMGDQQ